MDTCRCTQESSDRWSMGNCGLTDVNLRFQGYTYSHPNIQWFFSLHTVSWFKSTWIVNSNLNNINLDKSIPHCSAQPDFVSELEIVLKKESNFCDCVYMFLCFGQTQKLWIAISKTHFSSLWNNICLVLILATYTFQIHHWKEIKKQKSAVFTLFLKSEASFRKCLPANLMFKSQQFK